VTKRVPAHRGEMKLFHTIITTGGNCSHKRHFIPNVVGAFLEGEGLFYHLDFKFKDKTERFNFSFDPTERKATDCFTQPILSKLGDDHYSLMGVYKNGSDTWLAIIKFEGDVHIGYPRFDDECTLAIIHTLLFQ
jgi:hypothetical protein